MGSFNVACNLSGLSMGYEKALWIPLLPSNGAKLNQGNSLLIGINAMYAPIACPVFGELDSYGRLENIEQSEHTEHLEKYFGCTIEDLIDDHVFGDNGTEISGTFINRAIFDHILNRQLDECGRLDTNLENCYVTDRILRLCGFAFVENDESRERYNQKWVSKNGTVWWSDGTWGQWEDGSTAYGAGKWADKMSKMEGSKVRAPEYACLKEQNKFLHVATEAIENTSKGFSGRFSRFGDSDEIKELVEILKKQERARFFGHFHSYSNDLARDKMQEVYGEDFAKFPQDFANLLAIQSALWTCNRFWSPQANGYQDGNKPGHLDIVKKTMQILKTKEEW